ncbi:MAG TPA: glycoside hydrolase family 2 TIM barrel-domain containing protein [Polyangiaceae bacterium]|nr:glycoside hydrolase family 2 TIM barrel-domain containing protein [Polyangiaceae bacterium]
MPRRHLSQIGLRASIPPVAGDDSDPTSPGNSEVMGYPRPQLRRREWFSLNGEWDFALDPEGQWTVPEQVAWSARITVPFSPETQRSGIGDTSLYRACWYRRRFQAPALDGKQRLVLHFGAVDYQATVWVDGTLVARHEGGYTPFWVDITDALEADAVNLLGAEAEGASADGTTSLREAASPGSPVEHEIVVLAADDPADLAKPRGKQDWQLDPHSIWYPRTTGIWQTVWMERVNPVRLDRLHWTPNLERWEISLDTRIFGYIDEKLFLSVRLRVEDLILADDKYTVVAGEVHRRIALSDPGIDDFRNELLWSPERPKLIEAEIELLNAKGERLDSVTSYTALRAFAVQGDRFLLNGRPYPLRLVLDQGYWDGAGLTAPSDAHLRRDVELARAMGFNGVRKHQKIENPRYLYWADRLGLLVWEEMPSAYRFTRESVERMAREWLEVLRRDASHPCIMAWVPFNESWGVPNLPDSLPERNYVRSLYYLTKTVDPTRPVVGNDGWESVTTDIIGIHDYDENPERLGRRYWAHSTLPKLLKRERPAGRSLVLEGHPRREHPIVLSEFGGIAFSDEPGSWGYSRSESAAAFAEKFSALLRTTRSLEVLAGYCYTQFADTYQEANGLLRSDRTPKIPLEQIALATRGSGRADDVLPPVTLSEDDPTRGQRV